MLVLKRQRCCQLPHTVLRRNIQTNKYDRNFSINLTSFSLRHTVRNLFLSVSTTTEHLQQKLDDYIKRPFFKNKVRLFRNAKREGLIRSRITGAEHARAQILIFLDAHCECNPNWLPPLVSEIAVNRCAVSLFWFICDFFLSSSIQFLAACQIFE